MKAANERPDNRRIKETEQRLVHAAQELKHVLDQQERTVGLLVEVRALARDLLQADGERDCAKRLTQICPDLSKTILHAQDLARQASVVVDDLQVLLMPPL